MNHPTNFERVAAMNTAFGNPQGDAAAIDWQRVRKQAMNIVDELAETLIALGADPQGTKDAAAAMKWFAANPTRRVNPEQVRDGLCDIHVFAYGGHHLMGVDADEDMKAVLDGVMTRFIKDPADLEATVAMHAAKGVTEVYFEGECPTLVMKSAIDQPDAPQGKFLKSASYREPVFSPLPTLAEAA